jgi:hypothetical protein
MLASPPHHHDPSEKTRVLFLRNYETLSACCKRTHMAMHGLRIKRALRHFEK